MTTSWEATKVRLGAPSFLVPALGVRLCPEDSPFVLVDQQKLSADQKPSSDIVGNIDPNDDDELLLLVLVIDSNKVIVEAACKEDDNDTESSSTAAKKKRKVSSETFTATVNWWPLVSSHTFLRQEVVPCCGIFDDKHEYSRRVPNVVQSDSISIVGPDAIVDVAFVLHPSEVDQRGCRIEGISNAFVAEYRWPVGSRALLPIPRNLLTPAVPKSFSAPSSRFWAISRGIGDALGKMYRQYDYMSLNQGDASISNIDEVQWRWLLSRLHCKNLAKDLDPYPTEERLEFILRRKENYNDGAIWDTEEMRRSAPLLEVVRIDTAQKLGRLRSVVGDHVGFGVRGIPSKGSLNTFDNINVLLFGERRGRIDLIFDHDNCDLIIYSQRSSGVAGGFDDHLAKAVETGKEYLEGKDSKVDKESSSFVVKDDDDDICLNRCDPFDMKIVSVEKSTGVATASVTYVRDDSDRDREVRFDPRFVRDFVPLRPEDEDERLDRDWPVIAVGDMRKFIFLKMEGYAKRHVENMTDRDREAGIYHIGYEFDSTEDDHLFDYQVSQKFDDGSILLKVNKCKRDYSNEEKVEMRLASLKELHAFVVK